jgi:hypothetical protein
MFKYIFVLTCLLLVACQPRVYPIDSPYYRIPLGSELILNKNITIPPNRARVFIQNGHLLKANAVDQYYPFCEFEILTLSDQSQTIQTDRFQIHELSKQMKTSRQQLRYASTSLDHLDQPLIAYNTVMYLTSSRQPDVYRLSCMYWTDDNMDNHLTLEQIRKTLGKLFSIDILDLSIQ